MIVVPRELSSHRRFTLVTIALALQRFAEGKTATEVRAELSGSHTYEDGWASLHRWCRAIGAGRLFRWIRGVSELAGRALAERVSAVIAEASGLDARQASLEERLLAGVMSSPAT
jgi:hypothetical protein